MILVVFNLKLLEPIYWMFLAELPSDAGFTISSSSSIVLRFSFEGNVISAECGTLLTFELDGDATGFSEIIISDNVGNSGDFTYFAGDDHCPEW